MVQSVDQRDFVRACRGDRIIKVRYCPVLILTTGRASGYNLQEGATV
jgi:hypothetical protein